jgi:hypothetical protein
VNSSAMTVPTLEADSQSVEQLIVRVLGRGHRKMEALDATTEARAILQMAHSFADELAVLDPGFDRLQFIKDIAEDPS